MEHRLFSFEILCLYLILIKLQPSRQEHILNFILIETLFDRYKLKLLKIFWLFISVRGTAKMQYSALFQARNSCWDCSITWHIGSPTLRSFILHWSVEKFSLVPRRIVLSFLHWGNTYSAFFLQWRSWCWRWSIEHSSRLMHRYPPSIGRQKEDK